MLIMFLYILFIMKSRSVIVNVSANVSLVVHEDVEDVI